MVTISPSNDPATTANEITISSQSAENPSKPLPNRPLIAFISGHMDITPQQFTQHYQTPLDSALPNGHHFVIGDAKGVDATALSYLLARSHQYPDIRQRITIHLSRPGNLGKYQAMGVQTVCSGGKHDRKDPRARHILRDAGMTRGSDYDILWARSEGEERVLYGERWRERVSATEMNRLRRVELGRQLGSEK